MLDGIGGGTKRRTRRPFQRRSNSKAARVAEHGDSGGNGFKLYVSYGGSIGGGHRSGVSATTNGWRRRGGHLPYGGVAGVR